MRRKSGWFQCWWNKSIISIIKCADTIYRSNSICKPHKFSSVLYNTSFWQLLLWAILFNQSPICLFIFLSFLDPKKMLWEGCWKVPCRFFVKHRGFLLLGKACGSWYGISIWSPLEHKKCMCSFKYLLGIVFKIKENI